LLGKGFLSISRQSKIVDELENQGFSSLGNSALTKWAEAGGFRAKGVSDTWQRINKILMQHFFSSQQGCKNGKTEMDRGFADSYWRAACYCGD
jgi:hypothetical protein